MGERGGGRERNDEKIQRKRERETERGREREERRGEEGERGGIKNKEK